MALNVMISSKLMVTAKLKLPTDIARSKGQGHGHAIGRAIGFAIGRAGWRRGLGSRIHHLMDLMTDHLLVKLRYFFQDMIFSDLLDLFELRDSDAKTDRERDRERDFTPPTEHRLFLPHSHFVSLVPRRLVGVGRFLRVRIATVVVLVVAVVVRLPEENTICSQSY